MNLPPADIPQEVYNRGLKSWLATSNDLRVELLDWALFFAVSYRNVAPTRTGHLKSTARGSVVPDDWNRDRPMGALKVSARYAVWNLTGAGPHMHRRSTGRRPKFGPFKGDFTFSKILAFAQGNDVEGLM